MPSELFLHRLINTLQYTNQEITNLGLHLLAMETLWKNINVIDLSCEQCSMRSVTAGTPAAQLQWLASELDETDWKIKLSPQAIDEIILAAKFIEQNPVQLYQRNPAHISWPALQNDLQRLKQRLDQRPGFAVLHGMPIEEMPAGVAIEIYWLVGQQIAPPVAQKWNGEMIYSVRDTGKRYEYGVRGSHTSVELVFHVDNAFGLAVPDYVGLLCKHPAKAGGISRFCSLYTVHERLRLKHPDALQRLYQPMLFDRQKEHHESAAPVLLAPFFSWQNERLFARCNTSLVRKGYEVAGQEIDDELHDALSAVNTVCEEPDLWYEAPLERGHIQYLNNHEIGHYRSEFEDFEDDERKRHLYRLWHRQQGSNSYDGQAAS